MELNHELANSLMTEPYPRRDLRCGHGSGQLVEHPPTAWTECNIVAPRSIRDDFDLAAIAVLGGVPSLGMVLIGKAQFRQLAERGRRLGNSNLCLESDPRDG